MRGVKVLLKYILGILLKGREIVNHSTITFYHKKIKQQNIEFVIRPEVSVISTRLIATNWFVESSAR